MANSLIESKKMAVRHVVERQKTRWLQCIGRTWKQNWNNCAKATGYARAIQLYTKDQERWCHRGQRNNCDGGRIAWSCYRGDNLCCIGTDLIFNSVGGEK